MSVRQRIFKAINRECQTLMGAFKTAIGDTDFFPDEFLLDESDCNGARHGAPISSFNGSLTRFSTSWCLGDGGSLVTHTSAYALAGRAEQSSESGTGADVAEVVASLTRHLCQMHLQCAVAVAAQGHLQRLMKWQVSYVPYVLS